MKEAVNYGPNAKSGCKNENTERETIHFFPFTSAAIATLTAV
jgi:hypothetical protein